MVEWVKRTILKHKYFIRYAMIGVTGVTIDFLVFYFLAHHSQLHYQIANVISVSCGISNNFILNVFFNFKTKDNYFFRFMQFFGIGILGLVISAGLLWLFIDFWHLNELVSKGITIGIITFIQFNLNRIFTFRGYDIEDSEKSE